MGYQKLLCRSLAAALAAGVLVGGVLTEAAEVRAEMPYDTYSYNYWGEEVQEPHSYLYSRTISSKELGSSLNYPSDLFLRDDRLYIADTGNSRILITDFSGNLLSEITYADGEADRLKEPQGVFVTKEGHIYSKHRPACHYIDRGFAGIFAYQGSSGRRRAHLRYSVWHQHGTGGIQRVR